jgi:ribosomal protein S18 acetylase RimI-like enzyme
VSVTVEKKVISPGDDELLQSAWDLKEAIRKEEGLLKQRWGFFSSAYRRATVYLFLDEDRLIGFAAARRDGYVLFLGVDPEYRGRGFGKRLVASVAEDSGTVSCHARVANTNALDFYEHLGFSVVRRIDDYYEDGADAYYLKLGDSERLRDRISEFLRR